ncbi:amino acid permease [Angomonas deanei]|uniref:Transmembrane amino acid transporter protein/Tryptophan/tyrosine permease family, putative n=1 Tax=Angomonas deanei TaxID=59799 RepID=S9VB82_9TRYP|nr:amino acid permease [Angomonas deanei]EPY43040.1 amino acid permease [Angomonas deanei]CAD2216490.1 Transmembrane amino acid transporter protein/Tryptophan/tyrosine permease family, putative [Angomonas deanei]|eukprot:EPY38244.1 amino acid permease [Angomonas deanei]
MLSWGVHGWINSAFNLSVTTIGAGVLAIPSTFQQGGVVFVLLVLSMVALLTVVSIDYLVLCVDWLHLKSYEDISRELLGKTFEEAIRWILIVYSIGIAAGYVVVIGEIFHPMLPIFKQYVPFLDTSQHVTVAVWVLTMLPLSCLPKLDHLNQISFLAIASTFFISAVIVYRYFSPLENAKERGEVVYFIASWKGLLAVPVMMFSFDCQSLVFQIYTNLNTVSRKSMLKVSSLSVFITGTVYFLVGFFGYVSNTPNITGNILINYDPVKDRLMMAAQSFYALTVIIAYVLVLFPCRDAVFMLVFGYSSATHELKHSAIPNSHVIVTSFLLSVVSLLIALKAKSIIFLIAILGGLCSSTLCYTYPAAFRLALHIRGIYRCNRLGLWTAVFMLAIGVVFCFVGTAVALLHVG